MYYLVYWITVEWQHVSPEVTVMGFKMCCISNAADGTDNDMLWNGSEDGDSDTDW